MVAFYRFWKEDGMTKAEALQAAQAHIREDSKLNAPYYWAGFVLHGHRGGEVTEPKPLRGDGLFDLFTALLKMIVNTPIQSTGQ